jgi:heterodisulfide reductase subunit C
MSANVPEAIVPSAGSRKEIEEVSGQNVSACFQCGKCTNGCPVTFAMDIEPHKLLRLLQYGQIDTVLNSDTIWVCASCETCTTRCPNGIDIAHLMDALRQTSQRRGIKASQRNVPVFHRAFLDSIRRHGRVNETEMAITYALKDGGIVGLLKMSGMGLDMFRKGKIKLGTGRVRGLKKVRDLFRKAEADAS